VKCGFSVDNSNSNDDSAMKLYEDDEDDWHTLQLLGRQFQDYTTCVEVCGIQSVDQVLDQHLTRPEVEEEVAEYKATFLDALKGLQAARQYMSI
jgi:hypothetical protein